MKIKHLKSSKEFADVLAAGTRIRGKTLTLYCRQSPEKEPKVGLIISKKTAPLATKRNYIRRLIYSDLRERKNTMNAGQEIVVRLVKEVGSLTKETISREIRQDLDTLLKKAGKKQ